MLKLGTKFIINHNTWAISPNDELSKGKIVTIISKPSGYSIMFENEIWFEGEKKGPYCIKAEEVSKYLKILKLSSYTNRITNIKV